MATREQTHRRRNADDRLRVFREAVRRDLTDLVNELGGAIIAADAVGDQESRRQHSVSLAEVRAAQRVLFMDG
jgi:hypothetical protein